MSRKFENRAEVRSVRCNFLLSPNTRAALEALARLRKASLGDTVNALIERAAKEELAQ